MPVVKVEAPEGVALRVTVQDKTEKPSVITEQGFDADGNAAIVTKFGPKVATWTSSRIEQFATEVRSYSLGAGQRLLVESGS